jgi:hypothetical protein
MLNETQTEKLIERITDLLANDEQFSAAMPVEEVANAMLSRDIGLAELQQVAAEGYADRPALGRRATELVDTGGRRHRVALPSYETISYRDLGDRVTALAAALHDRPVQPGDRLATLRGPPRRHRRALAVHPREPPASPCQVDGNGGVPHPYLASGSPIGQMFGNGSCRG